MLHTPLGGDFPGSPWAMRPAQVLDQILPRRQPPNVRRCRFRVLAGLVPRNDVGLILPDRINRVGMATLPVAFTANLWRNLLGKSVNSDTINPGAVDLA